MFDYTQIQIDHVTGSDVRNDYFEGIKTIILEKAKEAEKNRGAFLTPDILCIEREKYREKYVQMLGWPLTEYTHEYHPQVKKELVEKVDFLTIYRLTIETLPGLWFTGILYVPTERAENAPLVLINPGGSYHSENMIAHGSYTCEQYRNIGGRVLEQGAILYAPQFLVWGDGESFKQPATRQLLDAKLKALGGSIAALEIYNCCRAIDYLVGNESVDVDRIGMMGLSYGGFYALYISAVETRIKTVFASCFFCDRFCSENDPTGCRPDWLWQNSANTYFDAEVAALIAPRALYIENGRVDPLFPIDLVVRESDRLKPFYAAAGASDKLVFHIGENGHAVSVGDLGLDFFMKNL